MLGGNQNNSGTRNLIQPNWLERRFILVAQGLFVNAVFVLYLLSSRTAHKFVGYFEEIGSY